MITKLNLPYVAKIASESILARVQAITKLQDEYRKLNDTASVNLIQNELDAWALVLDEREAWEYEHGTAFIPEKF